MEGNSGGRDRSARLEVGRYQEKKKGPAGESPAGPHHLPSGLAAMAAHSMEWVHQPKHLSAEPRTIINGSPPSGSTPGLARTWLPQPGGQGPVQWRPTGSAGTGSDTVVSDPANRRDRRQCRLLCYDSITWPRWGNRRRSRAAEMP